MTRPQDRPSPGIIPGLLLPRRAWKALAREGVCSLAALGEISDRLPFLPGIGEKTARMIREEMERVMERHRSRRGP